MDVPCSEETKLEMFNKVPTHLLIPVLKSLVKMSSHVNPVFTDRSVHMMMVVLALFHSEDPDESVRRIHEVINLSSIMVCNVDEVVTHDSDVKQDLLLRPNSKVALAMLRSYLRANHGEADYSTTRILRFFI